MVAVRHTAALAPPPRLSPQHPPQRRTGGPASRQGRLALARDITPMAYSASSKAYSGGTTGSPPTRSSWSPTGTRRSGWCP